jgi:hypothetical protein
MLHTQRQKCESAWPLTPNRRPRLTHPRYHNGRNSFQNLVPHGVNVGRRKGSIFGAETQDGASATR